MHNQNELTGIPADADIRKFTGVWIPAEIWLDQSIPATAKMLYAEIACFGSRGCWKKSDELREPLGIGVELFQKLCRQLKESGYITEKRMFGRIVRTTTLGFQSSSGIDHQRVKPLDEQAESPADEQAESPAVQKEYTKDNTKEHTQGASAPADDEKEQGKQTRYGNKAVNDLLDYWQEQTGFDHHRDQRERRAAHNLIQKMPHEAIKPLVRAVGDTIRLNDRFAPQITKPSDLVGKYSKLDKLRLWQARRQQSTVSIDIAKLYPDTLPEQDTKTDEERAIISQHIREAKIAFLRRAEQ